MLYITTRSKNDAYTAHKTLTESNAPDGGRYVPFRLPSYSNEELLLLKSKSFNQIIAEILNIFYASRLQCWDVDFCIGKNVAKLASMNHKIIIAELWHNLEGSFAYLEKGLHSRLLPDTSVEIQIWTRIAARIAVMFGLYGELLRSELLQPCQSFDVSVPNDDFITASAAWYCKKMGLPLHMIICACDNNSDVWDFIHRGEINTSAVASTLLPEMERLIQGALGHEEAVRFCGVCENGKTYSVEEDMLSELSRGLFCSVAGKDRAGKTINSVFRSNNYIIDPRTALCYSGLQDYRAKTGESGVTVILAERTPMASVKEICEATGIAPEKLSDYIDLS